MDDKRQEFEIITNGTPDLKLIPKEVAEVFFAALELNICAWIDRQMPEENKKGG